jgi:hypothetical protein
MRRGRATAEGGAGFAFGNLDEILRRNSVNLEGRLAALHSDPGWEGAVVDDSSPISPRDLKCCRATGQNRINIKF